MYRGGWLVLECNRHWYCSLGIAFYYYFCIESLTFSTRRIIELSYVIIPFEVFTVKGAIKPSTLNIDLDRVE